MPNVNASQVSAFLQSSFRGREGEAGVFSRKELGSLQALLAAASDPAAIAAVVDEFRAALSAGSLNLEPARRARIHGLFAELHATGRLPATLAAPAAGQDWVDALLAPASPTPPPTPDDEDDTPTVQMPLPAAGLRLGLAGGLEVWVQGKALRVGEDLIDLGDAHRSGPALQALLGMLRPDWTASLTPAARTELSNVLARGFVEGGLRVPSTGAGKLLQAGVTGAAAALLARLGAPAATHDGLASFQSTEPRPLIKLFLHDALGTTAALDDAAALRERAAWLLGAAPRLTLGGHDLALDPETTAVLWCGLQFCRGAAAIEAFLSELPAFAVALGDGPAAFEPAETQALLEGLQSYIDDSITEVFQFGLWKDLARKSASRLSHAIAVAHWIGEAGTLFHEPPTFGAFELNTAQADRLMSRLTLVRDLPAAERFYEALAAAREVVPWGEESLLPATSLALFQRVHELQAAKAEASPDGYVDYAGFPEEVRRAGAEIAAQLSVAHADLAAGRLTGGAVALSIDANFAAWFREVLGHRLGSERSLPNLLASAAAFAPDGALRGAPAEAFRTFLDGYFAQWPDLDVFDFNKLERLAHAAVGGNTVPLCRINDREIEPGVFHAEVGRSVKAALAHIAFPFRWIPHRWGYRAKQAAELIDLLAERARQEKGPIATLRKSFPGSPLRVIATTSDLEYNSLVFAVDRDGVRAIYYLDSEGGVHQRERLPEQKHVLFEAEIDDAGHVHVRHAARLSLSPRAYPLMNTYGMGDRIDVEFDDQSKTVRLEAAQRFETRYTVRPGTIIGYDQHGKHRVLVHLPTGDVERSATYEELRDWNNPHVVSETDGTACTVRFRSQVDKRFADDLEAMTRIAEEHGLPEFDMAMSETALAKVQKTFLRALNAFTSRTLRYPSTPPSTEQDKAYHDKLATGTHDMGKFLEVERGVCRHQFVREHMGKQRAGIDERFASGAANTYSGDFRGLHIWGEVSLADRSRLGIENPEPTDPRFLSDATWTDPYIPLWDGAYGNDLRRVEMYDRTDYYAYLLARPD